MRIPSSKLVDLLTPGASVEVRTEDYRGFDPAMQYTEAVALAVRGHVEGIASASGRIRYLRMLAVSERPVAQPVAVADQSTSTAFARTNMGVYREAVRQPIVHVDAYGNRSVRASGEIIGHTWSHCALRGVA